MKHRLATLIAGLTLLLPLPALAADLDVMIGQMLMAGFRGYTAAPDSRIARDIRDHHLGGVVLFDYDVALGKAERNIRNPEQVKALNESLQSYAATPLFIGVDQEGGKVQRLKKASGFHETPSALAICTSGEFKVRMAAYMVGSTCAANGFNLDFAPVADVNVNPDSPAIGRLERSFSDDPEKVTRCAEIYMGELKRSGALSCLKHFPGHGSAGTDSHEGLTDVTDTWTEAELIPYRELIGRGLPTMIMTAHIFNANLDPKYPATLSHKVITGLLRDKLGYDGVVVTDDMTMGAITEFYGRDQAIRLAILAGADILLFGNNLAYDEEIVGKAHAAIRRMVDEGTIPQTRIEQSYQRIMKLKATLN
ncbi:glycoside hydrolase family 3 protein [Pseudodesulfovibrio portus]|uniref:beta-N-acetylhexosaminidase n=1 Tax=Pseudodesulfovibrio portus TaxID=231439 RepID=A0ABM8AV23_9BACT|nr:glycoside hydrolase family 3 N-terminal domain-containing protein [Pseudodesulfovibrio portus]BDQ35152.1 glycosyl hydrolase [Pseudodesulfovibrio portus]